MHKHLLTLMMSMLLLAGCRAESNSLPPFPVGLWAGTYEDQPMSIEFRTDGRAILVYGGEASVALADYAYDPGVTPSALDIVFDNKSWGVLRTRIEQLDGQTLRLATLKQDAPRPDEFGPDPIVLRRSEEHVLPRGAGSKAERDKALDAALQGNI